MNRLFECLVLIELGCLGFLGIIRSMMLAARGIRVFVIDRNRTLWEGLADLSFLIIFLLWVYEALAFAIPLNFHFLPATALVLLVEAITVKVLGALVMTIGITVYGFALRAFGSSWRVGIDRNRPGSLVTGGIFARSRNPVYLGLTLLMIGVSLVLGRFVLLLLAIIGAVYFHFLVQREERFLIQHYGDPYRAYMEYVGRWWSWKRGQDTSEQTQ